MVLGQNVGLVQGVGVGLWETVREDVMEFEVVGEVEVDWDTEALKLTLLDVVVVAESPPPAPGFIVPTARWRL